MSFNNVQKMPGLDLEMLNWINTQEEKPPSTYDQIICYQPSFGDMYKFYITTGYALNNKYECAVEDYQPTHWAHIQGPRES